jgi:hypothetical protein
LFLAVINEFDWFNMKATVFWKENHLNEHLSTLPFPPWLDLLYHSFFSKSALLWALQQSTSRSNESYLYASFIIFIPNLQGQSIRDRYQYGCYLPKKCFNACLDKY